MSREPKQQTAPSRTILQDPINARIWRAPRPSAKLNAFAFVLTAAFCDGKVHSDFALTAAFQSDRESDSPALRAGLSASQARIGAAAPSLWERQVSPHIVEVSGSGSARRVVTFPAEHPYIALGVWLPQRCSPACTNHVVHEWHAGCADISTLLVDSAGALPPNPLSAGVVIFPNVIQESSALVGASAVPPAAEEEEVAVWVNPAHRTPARAGNICSGWSGLRSIRPGLIGETGSAAAGDPSPLLRRSVVLPKVVENPSLRCACSRGIEAESAEQPDVASGIGPQNRMLASAWSGGSRACSQSAVATILTGYVGSRGPKPSPLGRCRTILPQVIE